MNDETKPDTGIRGLWRWATKRPQVYVVYLITLILVWGISFLAGTLNPKRTGGQSPPPVSAPQR
ncbi:MAG TPA: hypothetical protein VNY08_19510 [Bradyrhizobium sp.]|jgi:hypothetical protein|nr:hypothetical protein [Bradyrhizobium sp.]